MTIHSFYFLSYALILTIAGVVMAWAYYSRFKNEGTPVNYTLLTGVFAAALAMWTGVAVTEYVYNPNVINAGLTKFFAAAWIGSVSTWQVNAFLKKGDAAKTL